MPSRSLYQPSYVALMGAMLSGWACAATLVDSEGFGVAGLMAFVATVGAAMPTFALWRVSRIEGVTLVLSSLLLSLLLFPLAWLGLFFVCRLAYSAVVVNFFPENWDLSAEVWLTVSVLPYDNIVWAVFFVNLAYICRVTTADISSRIIRYGALVLASGFAGLGAFFVWSSVVLAWN